MHFSILFKKFSLIFVTIVFVALFLFSHFLSLVLSLPRSSCYLYLYNLEKKIAIWINKHSNEEKIEEELYKQMEERKAKQSEFKLPVLNFNKEKKEKENEDTTKKKQKQRKDQLPDLDNKNDEF